MASHLQLALAASGIRQLRRATRRLAKLLAAPGDVDESRRSLQRIRAATTEWAVSLGTAGSSPPPRG